GSTCHHSVGPTLWSSAGQARGLANLLTLPISPTAELPPSRGHFHVRWPSAPARNALENADEVRRNHLIIIASRLSAELPRCIVAVSWRRRGLPTMLPRTLAVAVCPKSQQAEGR